MSGQPVQTTEPKAQGAPAATRFLQRKCACGAGGGLAAECGDCRRKKLLGRPFQAKRRVSAQDDEFEQEAESIARRVTRASGPPREPPVDPITPVVPLVQRRRAHRAAGDEGEPPIVGEVLNTPGHPLDPETRAFFEERFDHDFSRVRVHADSRAAASAREIDALAFTSGADIVFGAGQYAPGATVGNALLAHELTHVVQQSRYPGRGPGVQRAPAGTSSPSAEPVTDPAILGEVVDFLQSFQDLRELLDSIPFESSNRYRLNLALAEFDRRRRSLDDEDGITSNDITGALWAAAQGLELVELVVPEISARARSESDFSNLSRARRSLAALRTELSKLEATPLVRRSSARIEAESALETAAVRERQAIEAARRQTPEGRRDDAVEFTREFVQNDHQWWPNQDQAAAFVFAGRLGAYYLRDQGLTGAEIQMVLERLGSLDAELLDRALYQGELVIFLLDQGVSGLSITTLPHATGSGFNYGFYVAWRELLKQSPIAAPQFSAPSPLDMLKFELGLHWGVLVGIKTGAENTLTDVLSWFQAKTYTEMADLLINNIWDEKWRSDLGRSFAIALHSYLQDVTDDSAFEIGQRLGGFVGQALVEIVLGIISGAVLKILTKLVSKFRWGRALVEFAEKVADAMPWNDPRVVEAGDSAGGALAPAHGVTAHEGAAGVDTVTPAKARPVIASDDLPSLTADDAAFLETTAASTRLPGPLTKPLADRELAIVARAEKRRIPKTVDGYEYEVDLGNGHAWRGKSDGTWCRFSDGKTNCSKPAWTDLPPLTTPIDPLAGPLPNRFEAESLFVAEPSKQPIAPHPATSPEAGVPSLASEAVESSEAGRLDRGMETVDVSPDLPADAVPWQGGTPRLTLGPPDPSDPLPSPADTLGLTGTSRLHMRRPEETYTSQARQMIAEAKGAGVQIKPSQLGPDAPHANQHVVYLFYDEDGELMKVGQSLDLEDRVYSNIMKDLKDAPSPPAHVRILAKNLNDVQADALEVAVAARLGLQHSVPNVSDEARSWAAQVVRDLDAEKHLQVSRLPGVRSSSVGTKRASRMFKQARARGSLISAEKLLPDAPTPTRYAVYAFYDKSGRMLKVGITHDLETRVPAHLSGRSSKSSRRVSAPFEGMTVTEGVIPEGVHVQVIAKKLNSVQALHLEEAVASKFGVSGTFKNPVKRWKRWADELLNQYIERGMFPPLPGPDE